MSQNDEYIHVRDKETGHEYPVRVELFNAEAHEKTGKDALGHDGLPVAPTYRVALGDEPAPSATTSRSRRTPRPVPPADPAPDTNGQTAGSEGEN